MTIPIETFDGDHRFLSNFALAKVEYCGYEYPSAEHAYQAAKTLDPAVRREILAAKSPSAAKKMGRKVDQRPDWDKLKWGIMFDIVWTKFHKNPRLAEKLKETGDAQLIEGNWWGDTYFGVSNGQGANHLGKILELVRETLP
jgi:hypothetical protein